MCQELLVREDLQEPSEEQAPQDLEDHWAFQDPPENRALTVAPETMVFLVVWDQLVLKETRASGPVALERPEREAATEIQDHRDHQDHTETQDHQDSLDNQAAASAKEGPEPRGPEESQV